MTAFDAIHDQARLDHVLTGIRRSLKSDGIFLMQDIGASSNVAENVEHPLEPLLYTHGTRRDFRNRNRLVKKRL